MNEKKPKGTRIICNGEDTCFQKSIVDNLLSFFVKVKKIGEDFEEDDGPTVQTFAELFNQPKNHSASNQ